jgi:hypothetical protein
MKASLVFPLKMQSRERNSHLSRGTFSHFRIFRPWHEFVRIEIRICFWNSKFAFENRRSHRTGCTLLVCLCVVKSHKGGAAARLSQR